MPFLPCIRFHHRTIIEMAPLLDLLSSTERELKVRELRRKADRVREEQNRLREQERAEAESAVLNRLTPGPVATTTHPLGDFGYTTGWYGVDRHKPVYVRHVVPMGSGFRLEFSDEFGASVGRGDIEPYPEPPGPVAVPTRLENRPLSAELLHPALSLFRHPGDAGFWDRITTDCFDHTARLVYADWLDDHDDSHAWVFREPRPFVRGALRLDWVGAVGRVDCGSPATRPTMWDFARITGRSDSVPFTLSDGNPVPQFVAYLLGVTRIRAESPLPEAERILGAERGESALPLRLVGMNEGQEGRAWLFSASFEVGRLEGRFLSDLQPHSLSRRHAVVSRDDAGWRVADLGSTNGTYLNGNRLGADPAGPLRAGDVVQFAAVAFRVVSATPGV